MGELDGIIAGLRWIDWFRYVGWSESNFTALKVRERGNSVVEQNERFNDFMAHELGGPVSNRAGRQQEHETIVRNYFVYF